MGSGLGAGLAATPGDDRFLASLQDILMVILRDVVAPSAGTAAGRGTRAMEALLDAITGDVRGGGEVGGGEGGSEERWRRGNTLHNSPTGDNEGAERNETE